MTLTIPPSIKCNSASRKALQIEPLLMTATKNFSGQANRYNIQHKKINVTKAIFIFNVPTIGERASSASTS
jgi:hypothetical protein